MTKQSVIDVVAAGGEITYKKLYIGSLADVRRNFKRKYQLESRYGDYETQYNKSALYDDLEVAADRFMLIYNMLESGELK